MTSREYGTLPVPSMATCNAMLAALRAVYWEGVAFDAEDGRIITRPARQRGAPATAPTPLSRGVFAMLGTACIIRACAAGKAEPGTFGEMEALAFAALRPGLPSAEARLLAWIIAGAHVAHAAKAHGVDFAEVPPA